jgi:hypothetical protein
MSLVIIQVFYWIFDPGEGCDVWDLELFWEENNIYQIGEQRGRLVQQVVYQRSFAFLHLVDFLLKAVVLLVKGGNHLT